MPTERVVEIPWALEHLPQSGYILDIGGCETTYHGIVHHADRYLHCLDPRDCYDQVLPGVEFYNQSIIGNTLRAGFYDAVLLISTIEHIGLPHYDQPAFVNAEALVFAEIARLLKPGCPLIMTVPVGVSKVASWYRQYSPSDLQDLLSGWETEFYYWAFEHDSFHTVSPTEVVRCDYDAFGHGASAVAGVIARQP